MCITRSVQITNAFTRCLTKFRPNQRCLPLKTQQANLKLNCNDNKGRNTMIFSSSHSSNIQTPKTPTLPIPPAYLLTSKITSPALPPRREDDVPRPTIRRRPVQTPTREMQLNLRIPIARIRIRSLQNGNIIWVGRRIVNIRHCDGWRPGDCHGLPFIHRHVRCGAHNVDVLALCLRYVVDGGSPVDAAAQAADADAAC